jgi:hypothetical protein
MPSVGDGVGDDEVELYIDDDDDEDDNDDEVRETRVELYEDDEVGLALERTVEELAAADEYPVVEDVYEDAAADEKTEELLERTELTLEEGWAEEPVVEVAGQAQVLVLIVEEAAAVTVTVTVTMALPLPLL